VVSPAAIGLRDYLIRLTRGIEPAIGQAITFALMPGEYLWRFAVLLWEYAHNHDQRMEAAGPASGRDCHEGAPGGGVPVVNTRQPSLRSIDPHCGRGYY
jgi:hypothetical protein